MVGLAPTQPTLALFALVHHTVTQPPLNPPSTNKMKLKRKPNFIRNSFCTGSLHTFIFSLHNTHLHLLNSKVSCTNIKEHEREEKMVVRMGCLGANNQNYLSFLILCYDTYSTSSQTESTIVHVIYYILHSDSNSQEKSGLAWH